METKFKKRFKIVSWVVLTITFIAALSLAIMYFVITSENIDTNISNNLAKWKQDFLKYYAATNALIVSLNIPFWLIKCWLLIDGVTMKIHRDKQRRYAAKNTYKLIAGKVLNNTKSQEILRTQKNKIDYIINYFANYGARLSRDEAIYVYKNLKIENLWELKNYINQRCYVNLNVDIINNLIEEKKRG